MDGQKLVVDKARGREASLELPKYKKTLTAYRAGYAKTKMYSRYGWWTRSGLFRGEHRHIATYKGGGRCVHSEVCTCCTEAAEREFYILRHF